MHLRPSKHTITPATTTANTQTFAGCETKGETPETDRLCSSRSWWRGRPCCVHACARACRSAPARACASVRLCFLLLEPVRLPRHSSRRSPAVYGASQRCWSSQVASLRADTKPNARTRTTPRARTHERHIHALVHDGTLYQSCRHLRRPPMHTLVHASILARKHDPMLRSRVRECTGDTLARVRSVASACETSRSFRL
eukprot:2610508-Pleurochrysis_carterae.AAC.6